MAVLLSVPMLAIAALTFVLITVIKRRFFTSGLSDIPGPFLASFSLLWQLYHIFDGHTEEQLIQLHRKHGKFVRISHREVSVSDPAAIDSVLKTHWAKGEWYKIFCLPDPRYVNQMSECDARRHIEKNKNVAAGYTLTSLLRSEKHVDTCLSLMMNRFDGLIAAGKQMEPAVWFNFMAFDILGEVQFSKQFGFLEEGRDIGGAIQNTSNLAVYVSMMGFLPWLHKMLLGNPLIGLLGLQPNQHIFDTTLATIDARKKNPEIRRDMVEQWTERYQTVSKQGIMEEKEILCAAIANVGAGADTVSATMQAFFYYMIRCPKMMKRLREEIDQAHERGELSTPVVALAEAQKLPILQACIKETFRFHPAVGFGLPRVVPKEGATICGRFFPGGTILSVPIWPIHRNMEIFGDDCDSFNPERWLIDEIPTLKMREKYLVQFGAGYNMCPGRNLAQMEVAKATATLVRDYEFSQKDVEKGKWRFETHFTVVPYGWSVNIRKRSGGKDV